MSGKATSMKSRNAGLMSLKGGRRGSDVPCELGMLALAETLLKRFCEPRGLRQQAPQQATAKFSASRSKSKTMELSRSSDSLSTMAPESSERSLFSSGSLRSLAPDSDSDSPVEPFALAKMRSVSSMRSLSTMAPDSESEEGKVFELEMEGLDSECGTPLEAYAPQLVAPKHQYLPMESYCWDVELEHCEDAPPNVNTCELIEPELIDAWLGRRDFDLADSDADAEPEQAALYLTAEELSKLELHDADGCFDFERHARDAEPEQDAPLYLNAEELSKLELHGADGCFDFQRQPEVAPARAEEELEKLEFLDSPSGRWAYESEEQPEFAPDLNAEELSELQDSDCSDSDSEMDERDLVQWTDEDGNVQWCMNH